MKMNEEKSDRMEGESDPEYYFRKSLEQELPEAGNIKFKLYHKEEDDVGFLYSIEEGIKIVKYESSHYVKVNLIPWSEIANKLEDFIDQEEISLYLTKKGISVDNENYFDEDEIDTDNQIQENYLESMISAEEPRCKSNFKLHLEIEDEDKTEPYTIEFISVPESVYKNTIDTIEEGEHLVKDAVVTIDDKIVYDHFGKHNIGDIYEGHKELEEIVDKDIKSKRKRKSLKELPGDLFKNIVVGTNLYEGLEEEGASDCVMIPLLGQIFGAIGITGYCIKDINLTLSEAFIGIWVCGSFLFLANIWSPPLGVLDRFYGLYRTVKDYIIGSKTRTGGG